MPPIDWDQDEETRQKAHEIMIGLQRVGHIDVIARDAPNNA